MKAIRYRELKRMYQSLGPEGAVKSLRNSLRKGELKPGTSACASWPRRPWGRSG